MCINGYGPSYVYYGRVGSGARIGAGYGSSGGFWGTLGGLLVGGAVAL